MHLERCESVAQLIYLRATLLMPIGPPSKPEASARSRPQSGTASLTLRVTIRLDTKHSRQFARNAATHSLTNANSSAWKTAQDDRGIYRPSEFEYGRGQYCSHGESFGLERTRSNTGI